MIVTDVARAPGTVAERLTHDEALALIDAAAVTSARLLTQVRDLGLSGSMADEAHALASAVRKLDALHAGGDGLEVRAVPPRGRAVSAATEAPDTPRRHIDALARRAADCPHLSDGIEDEVALVSAITDRAAMERAFGELVLAHRQREPHVAETILDLLTGRLR